MYHAISFAMNDIRVFVLPRINPYAIFCYFSKQAGCLFEQKSWLPLGGAIDYQVEGESHNYIFEQFYSETFLSKFKPWKKKKSSYVKIENMKFWGKDTILKA